MTSIFLVSFASSPLYIVSSNVDRKKKSDQFQNIRWHAILEGVNLGPKRIPEWHRMFSWQLPTLPRNDLRNWTSLYAWKNIFVFDFGLQTLPYEYEIWQSKQLNIFSEIVLWNIINIWYLADFLAVLLILIYVRFYSCWFKFGILIK